MFAIVLVVAVGAGFVWPTGSKVDEPVWFKAGSVSGFALNKPVWFKDQRFWLVKLGDEQFIALLSRSPRRGCTVPWRPDFEFLGTKGWFRDLCFQSTWDITGHLAFGPSPRDMDRFPLQIVGGKVQVLADPKHVILGSSGGPATTSH